MLVDCQIEGACVGQRGFSLSAVSGFDFRSRGRLCLTAKSRSRNWVEAPLSIIAELVVSPIVTGMTIGSSQPRSTAELTDLLEIPVLPNPLDPRMVVGSSPEIYPISGVRMRVKISCAIRSPWLIWKGMFELLINTALIDPRKSLSTTPAPTSSPLIDNPDLGAILA